MEHTHDVGGAASSRKHGQDAGAAADVQDALAADEIRVALQSISVGLRPDLRHTCILGRVTNRAREVYWGLNTLRNGPAQDDA